MKVLEAIDLSKVLSLVSKPRFVLGTSYTLSLAFFESVVFPCIDRTKLKTCLIVCDALGYHHALAESAALQGAAQDYIVVSAPVSGSFHPKVWLIVGDDEMTLLTGSGNLTQAGFMTNAELFDAIHFSPKAGVSAEFVLSIRAFIKGLAGMWSAEDAEHLLCVEALSQIEQAVGDLPEAKARHDGTFRFIHSFQGPLIDQMPPGPDASQLYVAAPFFGNSLQGLNVLSGRYPKAQLNLFPAVHSGTAVDIPMDAVKKAKKGANISQLSLPTKDGAFAHLKLYGVAHDDETAWLCCTSANCTVAAWRGPNIEAGLLRAVSRSILRDLFVPGSTKFPDAPLPYTDQNINTDALQCWAIDTGAGLDLQVTKASCHHLPLSGVSLTVRVGSNLALCEKAALFEDDRIAHLPWTAFAGWQRRQKMAISLELSARNVQGKTIRAHCLVENRLLLSADPVHRSAWRGALALLDTEGAPELADIAAIFTLANDVFDGNLIRVPQTKPQGVVGGAESEAEKLASSVAVWPPQQDTRELRRAIGATGLGQLQWFQNILKSFLQAGGDSDTAHQPAVINNLDLDEDDDERSIKPRQEVEVALEKRALRIWKDAHKDYQRIYDKLIELCPTADNAANIWPAAIFTLLSTLAVFRATKRLAPDVVLDTRPDLLCDEFLSVMFNDRQQHKDFCCPKGFRYRSERFPPLAEDLQRSFKILLHPDLAAVFLSLMIDKILRASPVSAVVPWQKKRVAMVCGSLFVADADLREASRRIWQRFVCDSPNPHTTEFEAIFDSFFCDTTTIPGV